MHDILIFFGCRHIINIYMILGGKNMSETLKDMKVIIIIFLIASLVSFGSITALFIYSVTDHGTPVDKVLEVEDVRVTFYKSVDGNLIKLCFLNPKEETTQTYMLELINEHSKVIEKREINITYNFDKPNEYIFEAAVDINQIYYFKLSPVST